MLFRIAATAALAVAVPSQQLSVYSLTYTGSTSSSIARFAESNLAQDWSLPMPNVQGTNPRSLTVADGFVYSLTNVSSSSARLAKFAESTLAQDWNRILPNVSGTIAREFDVDSGFVYTLTNVSSLSARIAKFQESNLVNVWTRAVPNLQGTIPRKFAVADGFIYTLTNTSSSSASVAKFHEGNLSQVWSRTIPRIQSTIPRDFTVSPAAVTAAASSYGTTCGPSLMGTSGTRPLLGQAIDLTVTNLPTSTSFGLLAGGTSNQTWSGMPLPLPLDNYGLPGCRLYTSADLLWGLPYSGTSTRVTLPLPAASAFAGVTFYFQAAAGSVASNGVTTILGNN